MRDLRITTIFFVLFYTSSLYAQETIPATGGNAMGSEGSSSYTVGQVVYTKNTGINGSGSMAQGVQQPYEVSTAVGVELTEINLELNVYPNPTNNTLILNIGNYDLTKLTWQLYDLQGKLVTSKQVGARSTTISIHDLPRSTYVLNILSNNTLIKTFRIVKN